MNMGASAQVTFVLCLLCHSSSCMEHRPTGTDTGQQKIFYSRSTGRRLHPLPEYMDDVMKLVKYLFSGLYNVELSNKTLLDLAEESLSLDEANELVKMMRAAPDWTSSKAKWSAQAKRQVAGHVRRFNQQQQQQRHARRLDPKWQQQHGSTTNNIHITVPQQLTTALEMGDMKVTKMAPAHFNFTTTFIHNHIAPDAHNPLKADFYNSHMHKGGGGSADGQTRGRTIKFSENVQLSYSKPDGPDKQIFMSYMAPAGYTTAATQYTETQGRYTVAQPTDTTTQPTTRRPYTTARPGTTRTTTKASTTTMKTTTTPSTTSPPTTALSTTRPYASATTNRASTLHPSRTVTPAASYAPTVPLSTSTVQYAQHIEAQGNVDAVPQRANIGDSSYLTESSTASRETLPSYAAGNRPDLLNPPPAHTVDSVPGTVPVPPAWQAPGYQREVFEKFQNIHNQQNLDMEDTMDTGFAPMVYANKHAIPSVPSLAPSMSSFAPAMLSASGTLSPGTAVLQASYNQDPEITLQEVASGEIFYGNAPAATTSPYTEPRTSPRPSTGGYALPAPGPQPGAPASSPLTFFADPAANPSAQPVPPSRDETSSAGVVTTITVIGPPSQGIQGPATAFPSPTPLVYESEYITPPAAHSTPPAHPPPANDPQAPSFEIQPSTAFHGQRQTAKSMKSMNNGGLTTAPSRYASAPSGTLETGARQPGSHSGAPSRATTGPHQMVDTPETLPQAPGSISPSAAYQGRERKDIPRHTEGPLPLPNSEFDLRSSLDIFTRPWSDATEEEEWRPGYGSTRPLPQPYGSTRSVPHPAALPPLGTVHRLSFTSAPPPYAGGGRYPRTSHPPSIMLPEHFFASSSPDEPTAPAESEASLEQVLTSIANLVKRSKDRQNALHPIFLKTKNILADISTRPQLDINGNRSVNWARQAASTLNAAAPTQSLSGHVIEVKAPDGFKALGKQFWFNQKATSTAEAFQTQALQQQQHRQTLRHTRTRQAFDDYDWDRQAVAQSQDSSVENYVDWSPHSQVRTDTTSTAPTTSSTSTTTSTTWSPTTSSFTTTSTTAPFTFTIPRDERLKMTNFWVKSALRRAPQVKGWPWVTTRRPFSPYSLTPKPVAPAVSRQRRLDNLRQGGVWNFVPAYLP